MQPRSATPHPAARLGRLGFDRGWLRLDPSFLNLGLPSVLVDHRLIGPVRDLGFERFGDHNPARSFPSVSVVAEVWGQYAITLFTERRGGLGRGPVLAQTWFDNQHTASWSTSLRNDQELLIMVGDTFAIELGWAALWDANIGCAVTAGSVEEQQPKRVISGISWRDCSPVGLGSSA